MKRLDAFQIKLFMAFLMVFDHLSHIPGFISPIYSGVFHLITRCVGVWFAYMAVEGFIYTRSRIRYNVRLFLWAAVMAVGNTLLNTIFKDSGIRIDNNIFLTLAIGVLVQNILFYEFKKINELSITARNIIFALRIVLAIVVGFGGSLISEGGISIIPFIIITYIFRNKVNIRNIIYVAMSVFLFFTSLVIYPGDITTTLYMLMMNSDWAFLSVLPFIHLYNGQRGVNNNFSKYFFYVFYPAHLWIITVIAFFVAKGVY